MSTHQDREWAHPKPSHFSQFRGWESWPGAGTLCLDGSFPASPARCNLRALQGCRSCHYSHFEEMQKAFQGFRSTELKLQNLGHGYFRTIPKEHGCCNRHCSLPGLQRAEFTGLRSTGIRDLAGSELCIVRELKVYLRVADRGLKVLQRH